MHKLVVVAVVLLMVAGQLATPASVQAQTVTCKGSVGPGIPAPTQVPAGIPGFHASWYGQSGYPTICPGEKATSVVAYYNSGSLGWVQGRMGEAAYLGTWNWIPGQDKPSKLGGDGTNGTPNTGWPRYNRIAPQPAPYVGPGQVAWFTFTIQAPTIPGVYKLYLRPLVEGATWMEDYGVFWVVTVLNPDGTQPPPPPPDPLVGCLPWPEELGLMFQKLPIQKPLCLRPIFDESPLGFLNPYGLSVYVQQDLVDPQRIRVIGHEICHSHQYVNVGMPRTGDWLPQWLEGVEGQEFQRAWDSRFGTSHGAFEDFANVCSAWYIPKYYSVKIVDLPTLHEFAKKWLPK